MKIENFNQPRLIDVHTHAQFAAFSSDYTEVINCALAQNTWLVNVGTQKDTSKKAVEIAEKYEEGLPVEASAKAGVYATVGIHPIHTEKSFHDAQELGGGDTAKEFSSRGEEFDYAYYKKLGEHPKVVAIGECGFDFYRQGEETKVKQTAVFEAQINLAAELKKPLMIHCRSAYPDLIQTLKTNNQKLITNRPGIIHFFSGTKEDAKKLLELGFYLSFGGVVTFTRDYDEVIKYIGLERIVLETDAPYVAPIPYRGKRNEPAYVKYVAKKLAEILNKDLEEVAEKTTKNAINIFNIGTSNVPNIT